MAVLLGELGEGDGRAGAERAHGQVVAARLDGGDQGGADGGQVGDLRVDLGELGRSTFLEPRHGAAVAVAASLQQLGDLLQREPEPLGRLDHPQRGHRLLAAQAVTAMLRSGSASRPRRS